MIKSIVIGALLMYFGTLLGLTMMDVPFMDFKDFLTTLKNIFVTTVPWVIIVALLLTGAVMIFTAAIKAG